MQYYALVMNDGSYIEHHGIEGQKWGVRRWQNKDGTLTEAGRIHYGMQGSKKRTVGAIASGATAGSVAGAVAGNLFPKTVVATSTARALIGGKTIELGTQVLGTYLAFNVPLAAVVGATTTAIGAVVAKKLLDKHHDEVIRKKALSGDLE